MAVLNLEQPCVRWWCLLLEQCGEFKFLKKSVFKSDAGGVGGASCCFFFPLSLSGRCVIATLLPDIHPSCWIMSGFKRTCVDLWSGLTSSSHLCKWAWLGHCMTMWPCCRFITFFFHNDIFFSPYQCHFFFCKKKRTWQEQSEVFVAMHIR